MYDIIRKKRDGGVLSRAEIEYFIGGFTDGSIPDYQMSALAMAICIKGMTDDETAVLTDVMAHSGDMLDLSRFGKLSCDKHSTGGVGDKTSLIVAPIVASLGAKVSKMSGRGLGHTGGTIDKLESIPGYRTSLSPEEFLDTVEKTGMAVIGQTGDLAPADKKLYALRDVTATVDSIPLITSSIMSKKLAAGSKNIVLDVKCGSGAFMKTPEDAEKLARSMVRIGTLCGRNTAALITDMDTPLGMNIGNALEVIEAVDILKNNRSCDLAEVSFALAANMISLVFEVSLEKAYEDVKQTVASGKAFDVMKKWVTAQGGDVSYIEDTSLFPAAAVSFDVSSLSDGFVFGMDSELIGSAAAVLGAGRMKAGDPVDHSAGIVLKRKTGDSVKKGDVLCTLYTNDPALTAEAERKIREAVVISGERPEKKPLIYARITSAEVI